MAKGVTAALSAGVVVFGFDPEPGTPANRALHVLTARRALPRAELEARERFTDAAERAVSAAGLELGGRRRAPQRLHLVMLEDDPGRARAVTAWYYAAVAFAEHADQAGWTSVGRSLRLPAADNAAFRGALDRLRQDTRQLAGAVALLGDVFTGDDLLRLHVAL